jgi:hypothetical protein
MSLRRGFRAPALIGLCSALACSNSHDDGHACTDLYAYVTAVPIDSVGTLVPGPFTITDSVVRTGAVFDIDQVGLPGQLTVFNDSHMAAVSASGDNVVVLGRGGGGIFRAAYVFSGGSCHIAKVSGPDTVVVH